MPKTEVGGEATTARRRNVKYEKSSVDLLHVQRLSKGTIGWYPSSLTHGRRLKEP